ncbi:MAG: hypothetical protein JSW50_09860 [Candidatus Latescibacterota bacterium]|nr:MAG: hypothetical protein JSW50_09860 [Candidatus Latescibacterota bacterium]
MKLIAVVVAMMIWFNAIGQIVTDKTFHAPLEFINVQDSLTITGRVPDKVQVNITDTRLSLFFSWVPWSRFKDIRVQVNMSRAVPGRFTERLTVSDIVLEDLDPRNGRVVSPIVVDVILERRVSKRVRVAVSLAGNLQGDQLLSSVPEAVPGWVVMTGPESALTPLEKVFTKPIDLSKIKESVQREVELEFDRGDFECEPPAVTVAIRLGVRTTRLLANIPPTILLDEEDLFTDVYPKTVSLTLEGSKALLDTLSSGDVSVLVDLSGKPPGRYTVAPEVIVPEGVESYSMNVDSLRILINRTSLPGSM